MISQRGGQSLLSVQPQHYSPSLAEAALVDTSDSLKHLLPNSPAQTVAPSASLKGAAPIDGFDTTDDDVIFVEHTQPRKNSAPISDIQATNDCVTNQPRRSILKAGMVNGRDADKEDAYEPSQDSDIVEMNLEGPPARLETLLHNIRQRRQKAGREVQASTSTNEEFFSRNDNRSGEESTNAEFFSPHDDRSGEVIHHDNTLIMPHMKHHQQHPSAFNGTNATSLLHSQRVGEYSHMNFLDNLKGTQTQRDYSEESAGTFDPESTRIFDPETGLSFYPFSSLPTQFTQTPRMGSTGLNVAPNNAPNTFTSPSPTHTINDNKSQWEDDYLDLDAPWHLNIQNDATLAKLLQEEEEMLTQNNVTHNNGSSSSSSSSSMISSPALHTRTYESSSSSSSMPSPTLHKCVTCQRLFTPTVQASWVIRCAICYNTFKKEQTLRNSQTSSLSPSKRVHTPSSTSTTSSTSSPQKRFKSTD